MKKVVKPSRNDDMERQPRLLKFLRDVPVPGTEKFIAADAFGPDNPAGIRFWLGDNFKKHFLGKIEENIEPATLAVHQLERSSRDPAIMTELDEKRITKLAHFYELIKAQKTGQEGPLLVYGNATIAYIEEDDHGNLWAVYAYWDSSRREWPVDAFSVESPYKWRAGNQVLSRK